MKVKVAYHKYIALLPYDSELQLQTIFHQKLIENFIQVNKLVMMEGTGNLQIWINGEKNDVSLKQIIHVILF